MKSKNSDFPFRTLISFHKLINQYQFLANGDDEIKSSHAKKIINEQSKYPELIEGFDDLSLLKKHEKAIKLILQDLFSDFLSTNEIKAATVPFQNIIFNVSDRFKFILDNAGSDYDITIRNISDDYIYVMACTAILSKYFEKDLQFKRPIFYDIPDAKGILRHYRIVYNADFMEFYPTEKAPELTENDISELIDNFNNVELWKEKFPPQSWVGKGFVIANMFDVTQDYSISELKTKLLEFDSKNEKFMQNFQEIFRSLFNINDLKVGYSVYDMPSDSFETIHNASINSFILNKKSEQQCAKTLCKNTYSLLLKQGKVLSISDIDKYYGESDGKYLYNTFSDQNIKSAILAPISSNNKLLGILELVSPRKHELNSVTANRLLDVMPYITTSILRNKNEEENMIEAVIQKECTSIHPSVKWKFEVEAKKFLKDKSKGLPALFKDIVFKDVHPLYGQVDIKDSSLARNEAIQKDLITQLNMLNEIFTVALKQYTLPIYEEYNFRIKSYLKEIRDDFQTSTEQLIINFLTDEIHPALDHLRAINEHLDKLILNYLKVINTTNEIVYNYRKAYDDSVTAINKKLARVIDEKQTEAQQMFPHFFERYKTDGVEHNMYIGASISNTKKYSDVFLQNLKLWQLETICIMENEHYNLKPSLSVPLDVASLILVHSTPLSVKYRMDEKHFDVDGTYNARYEIMKKRIDKSFIKGTEERITKPGHVTIIYTQKKDEEEYLRYIKLLQAKETLSDDVNIYEIEDLQGVSGLKAISVGILYKQTENKSLLTYDDLMKEISK